MDSQTGRRGRCAGIRGAADGAGTRFLPGCSRLEEVGTQSGGSRKVMWLRLCSWSHQMSASSSAGMAAPGSTWTHLTTLRATRGNTYLLPLAPPHSHRCGCWIPSLLQSRLCTGFASTMNIRDRRQVPETEQSAGQPDMLGAHTLADTVLLTALQPIKTSGLCSIAGPTGPLRHTLGQSADMTAHKSEEIPMQKTTCPVDDAILDTGVTFCLKLY